MGRSLYVSGKLPTNPSPKLTFCPKREVSLSAGLGEGQVSSFLDTYTWARVKEKKRAQQTLWVTRVCLVPDQVKVKLAWEIKY